MGQSIFKSGGVSVIFSLNFLYLMLFVQLFSQKQLT